MKIGEILLQQKLITRDQLQICLWVQSRWGGLIGRILCSRGYLAESDLVAALGSQFKMPTVHLKRRVIPTGMRRLVSQDFCVQHLVLPFGQDPDSGVIQVAMTDPRDSGALLSLKNALPRPFRISLCGYLDLTDTLYAMSSGNADMHEPESSMETELSVESDDILEEEVLPRLLRATGNLHLRVPDENYELLEESDMLVAMAGKPAIRAVSEPALIVESGEFEVVEDKPGTPTPETAAPETESSDEKNLPGGKADPSDSPEPVDAPKEPPEGKTKKQPKVDTRLVDAPGTPKPEKGNSGDADKEPDQPDSGDTGNPVRITPEKPPVASAKKGLMSALAKGGFHKGPPPSPFSKDRK